MGHGDFELSPSAQRAREEFDREVDQVRMWVDERADLDPGHPWIERPRIYGVYKNWAKRDGHREVQGSEFYRRLEAIPGVRSVKRQGVRGLCGIKVIDTAETPRSFR